MVYSTGGDLHLELPGSSTNKVPEVHSDQWKIAPYRTKAIIKATFVARRENNHTAYIRQVVFHSNGRVNYNIQ